jgi:hypothetical protein
MTAKNLPAVEPSSHTCHDPGRAEGARSPPASSGHHAAGVFSVGDVLYERANVVRTGRLKRIVREWVVLSTMVDPGILDSDGAPILVVTLRAFNARKTWADYAAKASWQIADLIDCGTWSRTKPRTP